MRSHYEAESNLKSRRVIDVSLFYNELDLLELRMRTLYDHVDLFVISECSETFSGNPKPMMFHENRERYADFMDKIVYNGVGRATLDDLKREEWLHFVTPLDAVRAYKHNGRPPKALHASLRREITHRDAAVYGLAQVAAPGDLILLSDADEIPRPEIIDSLRETGVDRPSYLEMLWSIYYVNNRVCAPWFGTVAFTFEMLRGHSLDLLRYAASDRNSVPGPVIRDGGWHFSYLGGDKAIKQKLEALPYQGVRAELAKLINRFRPGALQRAIDNNSDLLLQNRTLQPVAIDNSFPGAIWEIDGFIERYARSLPDFDSGKTTS